MVRHTRMVFQLAVPSVGLLLLAVAAALLTWSWHSNPLLVGLATDADWAVAVLFFAAVGMGVWNLYRWHRWEMGATLDCECGGLLGNERAGRWGFYRQCLACDKNVARRHYDPQ